MVKSCFYISFSNDIYSQRVKLSGILEHLKNEVPYISEDDLFDLRIIYSELICNAIIHGNKNDTDKKVDMYVEVSDVAILSVITDQGEGFDYSRIIDSEQISGGDILRENGRGLMLVMELADVVEWNDSGNEVTFVKIL